MRRAFRYIFGTLATVAIIVVLVAAGVIFSGVYDIAANAGHWRVVRWMLTTLQENSVRRYARGVEARPLDDPALVREGLLRYQEHCLPCHGAPGVERGEFGRGLNPAPPRLALEVADWSDAELFWITRNGIKMTGMPSFSTALDEDAIWAVVAYMRRQVRLTAAEYEAMALAATTGSPLPDGLEWIESDGRGLRLIREQGNAEEGKRLLARYGCGACHIIPGIRTASGLVGPPLTRWAERHFIAGNLLNTPEQLIAWIVDPQQFEPGTLMPRLGVTPEEAIHMAAYLYTLGEPPRALHTVSGQ